MLLYQEACVKLLLERLYPSDIKYPIINITPDGKYAGILRPGGYNTYQILDKITSILGCTALSGEEDLKDTAPDLMRTVMSYQMKADDDALLKEIAAFIKDGGSVDVYSDLPLEMSEPVLDSLSYRTFLFQSNQKNELNQAYAAANSEDKYSIFITCADLQDTEKNGKVLTLVPKIVVLGIELAARTDPEYASRVCRETIQKHHINTDAVVTVAVSALSKDSDAVRMIAEDLGTTTEENVRLLQDSGLPGMKVLQYGFTSWDSCYVNHRHEKNCVVYTGTHDNTPTFAWVQEINEGERSFTRRYINSMNTDYGAFVWDIIREAYRSVADLCIIPIQDYLCKGKESRLNTPGVSGGNWQWRLKPNFLSEDLARSIRGLAEVYGRLPE